LSGTNAVAYYENLLTYGRKRFYNIGPKSYLSGQVLPSRLGSWPYTQLLDESRKSCQGKMV